jgi:glycosyltransferase involved in cell wall biosynthesis
LQLGPEDSNTHAASDRLPAIAHLLPWPTIGGVEIATMRLIESTQGQFRHLAFCMPGTAALQAACAQAGAAVVEYLPPEPSLRQSRAFLRQSRAVAHLLRRHRADLAHAAETKAAYHNSLATLLARVPLLSHVRSRYSELELRDRLTLLPVKRFFFVSKDSRRQFALKVPDARARVLYDGVRFVESHADAGLVRQELGVPQGVPLIGMVARVNPQKDYDTLTAAAAKVLAARPDAFFVIVGDNSEVALNREHFAHVSQRLRQLGIAGRFHFTGFRNDVPRLVSAFDIFVLCTHREGLPLSILEAMGMARPVLATAVDGIPEVLTEGVTGLLHPPGGVDKLASDILACMERPEYARALGEAARAWCRATFSAEAFAINAAALYREALADFTPRKGEV